MFKRRERWGVMKNVADGYGVPIIILATLTALFWPQSLAGQAQSSELPQIVPQLGHQVVILEFAFSPAGRWLASRSGEGIKLWDYQKGQELRTLPFYRADTMIFSGDGRRLAARKGPEIRIWEIPSGRLAQTWTAEPDGVTEMMFSPDGQLLAAYTDKELQWLELGSGVVHRKPNATIGGIAFSHDNQLLVEEVSNGRAQLVNAFSDEVLESIKIEETSSVELLPDASCLAVRTRNILSLQCPRKREGRVMLPPDLEQVAFSADGQLVAACSPAKMLLVWETASGRNLASAESEACEHAAFSTDGRWLRSGDSSGFELWRITTADGSMSLSVPLRLNGWRGDYALFSPDSQYFAIRSDLEEIEIYGLARAGSASLKDPVTTLKGTEGWIVSAAVSREGHWLAANAGPYVKIWDLQAGTVAESIKFPAESLAFTRNGALVAESFKGVKVFDLPSWRETMFFRVNEGGPVCASGTLFAFSDYAGGPRISVVNSVTGKILTTFLAGGGVVGGLAISRDSRLLAAYVDSGSIKIWNIRSHRLIREIAVAASDDFDRPDPTTQVVFTRDSNSVVAYSQGVKSWDVRSGQLRFSYMLPAEDPERTIPLQVSPDGRWLAVPEDDENIALFDLASGQSSHIRANTSDTRALVFTPDGRYLFSGGTDGSLRMFDAPSGKLRALAISAGESSDWMVISPDGLFDGSSAAWDRVLWRFSHDELVPAELFFNDYYHPGLLAEILAGKSPIASTNIAQRDRRQPQVKLSIADPAIRDGPPIASRRLPVRIDIQDVGPDKDHAKNSGAFDVRLFRNGSLVNIWRGDILKGKARTTLETDVTIVAGKNQLMAYAFNRDDIKSPNAALTVTGADTLRRQGTAYILSIGVNHYANDKFDLRYAVADADTFSQTVRSSLLNLQKYSRVEIIPLLDKAATRSNILLALRRLAGTEVGPSVDGAPDVLRNLQPAEPEDAVFIFYAGHGTASGPHFYLIPHDLGYAGERDALDEASLKSIFDHSISEVDLDHVLDGLDIGTLVLVVDACRSGQVLQSEDPRQGPMNSRGLTQLAYDKGMYILTASQGYQAALEATKYHHGLLTYALIEEGLKSGKADDNPRDGKTTLREWLDYASHEVPKLQVALMRESRAQGRNFAVLGADQKIEDLQRRSLQRPRLFYRREVESQQFVIARSQISP
jgi:WD40 repeat protein